MSPDHSKSGICISKLWLWTLSMCCWEWKWNGTCWTSLSKIALTKLMDGYIQREKSYEVSNIKRLEDLLKTNQNCTERVSSTSQSITISRLFLVKQQMCGWAKNLRYRQHYHNIHIHKNSYCSLITVRTLENNNEVNHVPSVNRNGIQPRDKVVN